MLMVLNVALSAARPDYRPSSRTGDFSVPATGDHALTHGAPDTAALYTRGRGLFMKGPGMVGLELERMPRHLVR
jgi:hypothetical protein